VSAWTYHAVRGPWYGLKLALSALRCAASAGAVWLGATVLTGVTVLGIFLGTFGPVRATPGELQAAGGVLLGAIACGLCAAHRLARQAPSPNPTPRRRPE